MYLIIRCECGNKQVKKVEEKFLSSVLYCGKCGSAVYSKVVEDGNLTSEDWVLAQECVWEENDALENKLTQLVKSRERMFDFLSELKARLNF